jgi:N-succinyldiaminopimelate aminotransferase
MKPVNSVLASFGTTIFEVMSTLAREHGSINLGQGFPDEDGPPHLKQVVSNAMEAKPNQYPPMPGVPELRQAVAAHNKRFYDLDVSWENQVLITSGATEALAASMLALIEPGDEVIVMEPVYDSYVPMILRAGGIPKPIRLLPPDWGLNEQSLGAAFSDKTKLLLLNTPHNPAGKVYTPDELEMIAAFVIQYDAYVVCDEVYEHIVFDDHAHTPLMGYRGMEDRCLRIGSAGKTFSMTGWKVGYVTAPPALYAALAKAHQFLTFTTPPLLQYAVADGLQSDDDYFEDLRLSMQQKRDRLSAGLSEAGFGVLPVEGTYFLTTDIRQTGFTGTDVEFCQHITENAGVTALPMSAFYLTDAVEGVDAPGHFVRFCFCKQDTVLDAASEKLISYFM